MTAFPKYPAYKASGVAWLGEVPEHWRTEKGKWLFHKMERPPRKEDDIVTAFRDGQVTLRINRRTEGFTNAIKEHGYQGIRKGDLVIHAMDAFAGAIGVSDSDGKSTPVYSACVPRIEGTVNPYFYAYLLRYMAHSGFITTLAKGIRERSTDFRFNDFALLELPLPDQTEQGRIVAFLDEKTAQIDALIAKKQRQIELLDEQKTILINRAVTRGLHPNPDLQDSGIPWIGPIPKGWEMKRVKHCSLYFTSGSRGWGDYYADCGDAFLQSGDLTDNCTISLDKVKRVKLPRRTEGLRTRLESHDTVVCITGANTGRVANVGEVQETIFVNQHLCLVRPSKSINPQYLSLALSGSAGRTHFTLSQYGLKEGLNLDDVKNCLFPLPPIHEQAEILAYIQGLSKSIETTIAKVESQIQTLQTLRSTLIAHAVTGKIAIPAATA